MKKTKFELAVEFFEQATFGELYDLNNAYTRENDYSEMMFFYTEELPELFQGREENLIQIIFDSTRAGYFNNHQEYATLSESQQLFTYTEDEVKEEILSQKEDIINWLLNNEYFLEDHEEFKEFIEGGV